MKRFYMVAINKSGKEVHFNTEVLHAKNKSQALNCFKNTFKKSNVSRVVEVNIE